MDPTPTLQTVGSWPVADQLSLVFRLWDQILDTGWQPSPDPALLAELDRRLAAHAADPSRALTRDQVVDHVRRNRYCM
ncbi:addiction module protein [Fimbriiglobus ruber]|uniref:addiction module protein n=1 Tax=Fimbriiglobus ruber TaxID=1908690 RepID=UPI001379F3BE|nr:addiction module protein [Fimbriiglobus ruber]